MKNYITTFILLALGLVSFSGLKSAEKTAEDLLNGHSFDSPGSFKLLTPNVFHRFIKGDFPISDLNKNHLGIIFSEITHHTPSNASEIINKICGNVKLIEKYKCVMIDKINSENEAINEELNTANKYKLAIMKKVAPYCPLGSIVTALSVPLIAYSLYQENCTAAKVFATAGLAGFGFGQLPKCNRQMSLIGIQSALENNNKILTRISIYTDSHKKVIYNNNGK